MSIIDNQTLGGYEAIVKQYFLYRGHLFCLPVFV
jgi:hypothetical protein